MKNLKNWKKFNEHLSNLDDVFISAKNSGQLDEIYDQIINAEDVDELEYIDYMDDVIMSFDGDLDKIKEYARELYLEYK